MDSKIKILIVEDEALIAENLKLTLEDLGYEVTGTCYNFTEAVEALATRSADIALLDINLGSRDEAHNGLALGAMLTDDGQLPFIFLTAYSDIDTIKRATKLRPSGYLIKPVNAATLFAAIQTAMERNTVGNEDALFEEAPAQPEYFFVKVGTKNHRLLWEEVYCIESGKNYVKLRLHHHKTEYPIRGTLTFVLEGLLPQRLQSLFIRINRSTSLNIRYITAYNTDAVFCGEERFENTRLSQKELADLVARGTAADREA